jgi:hypothetical protein
VKGKLKKKLQADPSENQIWKVETLWIQETDQSGTFYYIKVNYISLGLMF